MKIKKTVIAQLRLCAQYPSILSNKDSKATPLYMSYLKKYKSLVEVNVHAKAFVRELVSVHGMLSTSIHSHFHFHSVSLTFILSLP